MTTKEPAPAKKPALRTTNNNTDITATARAYHFLLRHGTDPLAAAAMAPELAAEAEKVRRQQDNRRSVDHMVRQRPHQLSRGGGHQTLCACGKWMSPESGHSVARHQQCDAIAAIA